jgi:hypothetical protein
MKLSSLVEIKFWGCTVVYEERGDTFSWWL